MRTERFKGALLSTLMIASLMALAMSFLSVSRASAQPLGIVSYWTFDDGTAKDTVGTNDGTIYGATWTTGKVDDALSFDGDGDYVWVSDDPSLDISEKITIEAWVNITDRSGFRAVVVKQGNYHFRIHNGYLGFVFWTTSGWRGAEDDTTLLDTLTWYHIAVSFDTVNDVIKFYVNGNNVKTITNVWDMITNDNPFTIGRQTGALYTNYFNGIIDEVAIYNRILAPEEIQQHYENGLKGLGYTAPPPVGVTVIPVIILAALIAITAASIVVYRRRR